MPNSDARKHQLKNLFVILLMMVVKVTVWAQIPQECGGNAKEAAFEVVSVREAAPAAEYSQGLSNDPHSSNFTAENFFISQLIGEAFGVDSRFQVIGIPDWIKRRRFQVTAKAEDCREALKEMELSRAKVQKQLMIQSLLQDRFRLRVRIETRMLPEETLVQSTGGVKMVKSQGAADQPSDGYSTRSAQGVEIKAKHMSVSVLVGLLQGYLRTTVEDGTNLKGPYAINLRFTASRDVEAAQDPAAWPPPEVAVEEQLGLKLVESKKPTPVIVVENIELPTPN